MKKFFPQIILCILCFLCNWYKDNLLLPIFYIIKLFLIIILLFCYYDWFKKKKYSNLKVYLTFFCFITTILFFYDFRLIKAKIELNVFEDQRNIVIRKIKNNEFDYYSKNNIKLPIYKYTSNDGEVHVYKNENNDQVICFWIYRGIMSSSIQLVYTSNEKLIDENIKHINKNIKLKKNWYYIITK